MEEKAINLVSGFLAFTGGSLILLGLVKPILAPRTELITAGIGAVALSLAFTGLRKKKQGNQKIFNAYMVCSLATLTAAIMRQVPSNIFTDTLLFTSIGFWAGSLFYIYYNSVLPKLKEQL
ncbi:MAG: hypothetical protein ABEJ83_01070 [Candidatus Nanohaloarchaea archaeon]